MSDLSKETRDLLTRGRGGTGMPTRRRSAIKGAVLAKAAAGTVITTSATAAAWTATTKAIGMAAVALAVGGGTVGVVRYENAKAERENAAAVTARTNSVTTTAQLPSAEPTETTTEPTPLPIPVALLPEPALTNAAPVPVIDRTTTTAPSTSTSTSTSPATTTTTTTTTTTAIAGPVASSSLGEETALLREAHEAIANGDAPQALSLLEEHARRFPTSALEPERSAERVFAYCAEHDKDAARGTATGFLASHPTGPLSDRVRSSCGGTK
ncbi:MAG: hypothetical protein ABI551_10220 [Polyangiaceae bacterium]